MYLLCSNDACELLKLHVNFHFVFQDFSLPME